MQHGTKREEEDEGVLCPECERATMNEDDHVYVCPACDYETSEPREMA